MALERSAFTFDLMNAFVQDNYGLRIDSAEKLPLGTANCFRLASDGKHYFLKEFQSNFTREAIELEAQVTDFLTKNNVPIAHIYPTVNGRHYTEYAGHYICLSEYIEGTAYGYDDLPERLMSKVASMLGKLHTVMKPLCLPCNMGTKWLGSFSAETLAAQYAKLESEATAHPDDPNSTRIIEDMQYKAALARRCVEYIKYHDGITHSSTHGDYQACQLIWNGDDIAAVIDFSSAATLPLVWEIMRSFVQSSRICRSTAVIDIDSLCEYVTEYMKYATLTRKDLAAMPYVYLFQLARSKYGYGQYLNSDSEDRDGLLKFAFWRTDMCREVEKQAYEISEALTKLI